MKSNSKEMNTICKQEEQILTEDKEWVLGLFMFIVIIFGLGFIVGTCVDESIKVNNLAQVLYKDTDEYLQHEHDNFYDLLKLIERKE